MAKKDALSEAVLKAERNAIIRDAKIMSKKRMPDLLPDLSVVDDEEAKANAMIPRHTIVKVREKNKARFAQVIQANLRYLLKKKYLTTAEQAFLFRILGFVEFGSNALVNVKDEEEEGELNALTFIKVSELAREVGMSISQTRKLISSLLKKGILYEVVDTQTLREHGRPTEERPLFANPELIIAMDKNRINLTLCRIHWANDRLEKNGIKLPLKIWYAPGAEYGRLYTRKTWLKKRKQAT